MDVSQKKQKPKRSVFDYFINFICVAILFYFVVNEFNHLYRSLDTIRKNSELFERHYILSSSFPFVGSYFLMAPENYDPKYKYPLVISLHGVSKHAYSAAALASPGFRRRYPFFVMVPMAPPRAFWLSPKDKNYRMPSLIPFPDHMPVVMSGIKDIMNSYEIDENKIIMTGHSMGASGVIGAMQKYPDFFAAGIASSGVWSPNEITNIKKPLFVFHGTKDKAIPVSFSQELERAARNQNLPIKVSYIQGKGHGIGPYIYENEMVWDAVVRALR
ncbi:MAG: prolyl oligopeptidase family serine peptidase [Cellvibrionaceae bacterium]